MMIMMRWDDEILGNNVLHLYVVGSQESNEGSIYSWETFNTISVSVAASIDGTKNNCCSLMFIMWNSVKINKVD